VSTDDLWIFQGTFDVLVIRLCPLLLVGHASQACMKMTPVKSPAAAENR
jgi:hypothetical protein